MDRDAPYDLSLYDFQRLFYEGSIRDSFQFPDTVTFSSLGAGPTSGVFSASAFDLLEYTQVRFVLRVGTAGNTSDAYLQYSLDDSTFATLTANTVSLGATGIVQTDWEDMPAAARSFVFVRMVGVDGDESESPEGRVIYQFRR